LALVKNCRGEDNLSFLTTTMHLAELCQDSGDLVESEKWYRSAVQYGRKFQTNSPSKLEDRLVDLAECLYRQSKFVESENLYAQALASRQARLKSDHEDLQLIKSSH